MSTDLELRQQVISRLELEPKIDAAALQVAVQDGVVTLRGTVDNEADRICTERVLRVMHGVKGLVDDDLKVKTTARSRRQDADLQADACEAIKWLTTVPQENVQVTVQDGWVLVTGEIESHHQVECMEALLREIPGIRGVKNSLKITNQTHAV